MPRPFRLAVGLLALWPATALSAAPPDFTGSWSIDDAASQPMDPVFEIQGLSWIQRKAAAGFDSTAEITQEPDRLIVRFDNILGKHRQELFFDGAPHATVNPAGIATTFTSKWSDDGVALLAAGTFQLDDGVSCTLSERRTLSADKSHMSVLVEIKRSDGQSASARSSYKRD
jgi:hypothetical protein